jgi:hypothetical protein
MLGGIKGQVNETMQLLPGAQGLAVFETWDSTTPFRTVLGTWYRIMATNFRHKQP